MARPWPLLALAAALPALGAVAITHVTVIDVVTGGRRQDVTVVTEGDRIAGIGAVAIPRGATRIDGRGKFLIPGLWDMHTHHLGTGAESLDIFASSTTFPPGQSRDRKGASFISETAAGTTDGVFPYSTETNKSPLCPSPGCE
jgi:imidazolonepropionase-like amidohydrolase